MLIIFIIKSYRSLRLLQRLTEKVHKHSDQYLSSKSTTSIITGLINVRLLPRIPVNKPLSLTNE